MTAPPHELLAVAAGAARVAGALLRERFEAGRERAVRAKSTPTDLASEADLAAEAAIREELDRRRPGDALLAEEGGGDETLEPGRTRWIVDPLDGTINFLFGIPHWCVSIACEDERGTVAGVILDPMRDELFAATLDGPVTLNGAAVEPAPERALPEALIVTGFAYDAQLRARQGEVLVALLPQARDVRRMGSAALDLAWLSAGRYDAYYERSVKVWDVAAGVLMARRAGLQIRELEPRGGLPWGVMAGPPALLDAMSGFRP